MPVMRLSHIIKLALLVSALSVVVLVAGICIASPMQGRGQSFAHREGHEREHFESREQGRREWDDHERQARHYYMRPQIEPCAGLVYAPPLIYQPMPAYSSGCLNFIVPLNVY